MKKYSIQGIGNRLQEIHKQIAFTITYNLSPITLSSGFTLLETMVAITLLAVAIVAPMTLTAQSLASAYYARDEITAFYLAQEGLETVREVRDNNILFDSQGGSVVDLLSGIPINVTFRVDAPKNTIVDCTLDGSCGKVLQTDGTLYGYDSVWTPTQFTRTGIACYVQPDGSCTSNATNLVTGLPIDEVKVTVTVTWRTGSIQQRSVVVSENLYKWVCDGAASASGASSC
jgi:prepilin-type N-terminal cleavage/methylation domain-containing protein